MLSTTKSLWFHRADNTYNTMFQFIKSLNLLTVCIFKFIGAEFCIRPDTIIVQ
jgi:hypothetical protein